MSENSYVQALPGEDHKNVYCLSCHSSWVDLTQLEESAGCYGNVLMLLIGHSSDKKYMMCMTSPNE